MRFILALIILSLSVQVQAGRERDGGWPQSIKVLSYVKELLTKQVSKLTEPDIKTALNGMKDRDEALKPSELNKDVLLKLIASLEIADVVELENSKYEGARLFHYENNYPQSVKIFATKRFYNQPRYQQRVTELTLPVIKEIQKRIIHEISHIWGYGEDSEEMNYANIFASRLLMIIYGHLKKEFTNEEKLELLNKSFNHIFQHAPKSYEENYEFIASELVCYRITDNSSKKKTLNLEKKEFALKDQDERFWSETFAFESDKGFHVSSLKSDRNGFVMIEEAGSGLIADTNRSQSLHMKRSKPGSRYYPIAYTICHADEKELESYEEKFITSFYTKDPIVSGLVNLSLENFKFSLQQRFSSIIDSIENDLLNSIMVQKQQIHNIEQVIKVEHKDEYEKLISFKSRYSKKKHSALMEKLSKLMLKDIGEHTNASNLSNKVQALDNEIRNLKNYERQLFVHDLAKDFFAKRDEDIKKHNELVIESKKGNMNSCYGKKRIGQFYECQLERNASRARRLQLSLESILNSLKQKREEISEKINSFNY